ncbi:hypothetical protein B0H13DRAFT_2381987 [Mycena leptocephala]|nr:hypothetical protein B0H13DRAFT_2381987 [Mycena leptocephala]
MPVRAIFDVLYAHHNGVDSLFLFPPHLSRYGKLSSYLSLCWLVVIPTSSLRRRRLALEAKHSLLYPITTTALGIRGVKLEVLSPRPPLSLLLPHNYQGHRLAGFILRTGAKNNDLSVAGTWVQPCTGCATCKGRKKRVFVHVPALPPHILADAQLELWAMARNELYPTRSGTSAAATAAANISHSPLPSPLPSPSPSPVPLTVSATSTSAAAAPSPSPPPPMPFPRPSPLSVNTPLHRSLNYHYGGYGGVEAHYSPAGEILVPTSILVPNSDDGSDVGDLLVCIWHAENTVGFLSKLLHPWADELPSFRVGELILADYRDELEAMGLVIHSMDPRDPSLRKEQGGLP